MASKIYAIIFRANTKSAIKPASVQRSPIIKSVDFIIIQFFMNV